MNHNEQELMELMLQLEAIMRREAMRRYHTASSSFNPHRGQGRIMSLLKLQPEISQKDLSFLLDMSKQALAELLGKLENAGYIMRFPSEEDRRIMMIRLTDTGKAAAEKMDGMEHDSDSVFACLTDAEQETFRSYLQRLIAEGEKLLPEGLKRHQRRMHGRFSEYRRDERK